MTNPTIWALYRLHLISKTRLAKCGKLPRSFDNRIRRGIPESVLAPRYCEKVETKSSSTKADSPPSSFIREGSAADPNSNANEGSQLVAYLLGLQNPGQACQPLDLTSSLDAWSRVPNAYFGKSENDVATSAPTAHSSAIYSEASNVCTASSGVKGVQSTLPFLSHSWVQPTSGSGKLFSGDKFQTFPNMER